MTREERAKRDTRDIPPNARQFAVELRRVRKLLAAILGVAIVDLVWTLYCLCGW